MAFSTTRRLRASVLVVTFGGLLALAACGSDDSTTPSSAPSTSAAAPSSDAATTAASSAAGSESSAAGSPGADSSAPGSSAAADVSQADIDAAKATLIEPGKLTVCTTLPFEPFQSAQGGKIVGFDVDIVDLVAAKLGVEQSIIDTPFEGIKSGEATNTGKCDAAAAGMSITAEREKVMNFSVPYFDANFALVVPAGSTAKGLEDLKGKKIAGQASTTGLDYLNAHKDEFGYEVVEYTGFDLQSQALLTGQVDGALNDTPVFKKLLSENADKIAIVKEYDSGDSYGVGMKKGNDALKKVFDAVFTASKANGEYKTIYEKWIGPYSG